MAVNKVMGAAYGRLKNSVFSALYADVLHAASPASNYVVHVHGVNKSRSVAMEHAAYDLRVWYLGACILWVQRIVTLPKVARTLHPVHDKGIVHKDATRIDLLNFYVVWQLQVKISDFDIR